MLNNYKYLMERQTYISVWYKYWYRYNNKLSLVEGLFISDIIKIFL